MSFQCMSNISWMLWIMLVINEVTQKGGNRETHQVSSLSLSHGVTSTHSPSATQGRHRVVTEIATWRFTVTCMHSLDVSKYSVPTDSLRGGHLEKFVDTWAYLCNTTGKLRYSKTIYQPGIYITIYDRKKVLIITNTSCFTSLGWLNSNKS